jgi:hypothetical protein
MITLFLSDQDAFLLKDIVHKAHDNLAQEEANDHSPAVRQLIELHERIHSAIHRPIYGGCQACDNFSKPCICA